MRNKKGFIKINNTGFPDIPIKNITSTPPYQNFNNIKGKEVSVSTSFTNNNTTRENTDYSNLSIRNQEEIISSESKLEINISNNSNNSQ